MIRLPAAIETILTELAEFGRRHDEAETEHSRRLLNLEWPAAETLHLLVRLSGRRRVLEIGTSNGFSTLWLAAALPATGASLVSIERDREKQKQARFNLERAGLADKVTLLEGEASAVIAALEGPFDCVFFDADRVSAPAQLGLLLPKLAAGAAIFTDNVLSHPAQVAAYLDLVANDPRFDAVTLPVGKGLHMAVLR